MMQPGTLGRSCEENSIHVVGLTSLNIPPCTEGLVHELPICYFCFQVPLVLLHENHNDQSEDSSKLQPVTQVVETPSPPSPIASGRGRETQLYRQCFD